MREHTFPDRLRLPVDFDPIRLAADLHGLHGIAWSSHFVSHNCDGDWSAIALRVPADAHPVRTLVPDATCRDFVDTPALAASPYFRQVLASFACPLLAVRLIRLAPASRVMAHRDHDLALGEGTVRIHVPVTTNDAVDFRLNGTRCVMPAGTAWCLRLSDPHSIVNEGPTDRVHMVIDAAVNGWIEDLLARALAGANPRAA